MFKLFELIAEFRRCAITEFMISVSRFSVEFVAEIMGHQSRSEYGKRRQQQVQHAVVVREAERRLRWIAEK